MMVVGESFDARFVEHGACRAEVCAIVDAKNVGRSSDDDVPSTPAGSSCVHELPSSA
jgi:hypothetical protein